LAAEGEVVKDRPSMNRFIAGRTLHTCNKFELEFFEVDAMGVGALLLVHDGTKPVGTLPDIYERAGETLRLVEWWT
jgi:hypothetical protein